jgi:DNA-binding transcriptional ArsR family regulator
MTPDLQALATLDRVVHEPARLMIMTVLYAVPETDFLYLQRECGLTQGNLSSHLAKLEEAKYVTILKTFKGKYPLTICSLTKLGREAFEDYVRKMRYVAGATAGGNGT